MKRLWSTCNYLEHKKRIWEKESPSCPQSLGVRFHFPRQVCCEQLAQENRGLCVVASPTKPPCELLLLLTEPKAVYYPNEIATNVKIAARDLICFNWHSHTISDNMQYAYRLQNFLLVPFGFLVTLWWCYRCWFFLPFHVAEYNWDILFLANHRRPKGDWVGLAVFHHLGSLEFSIVECIWREFANSFVLKYKGENLEHISPKVRDN